VASVANVSVPPSGIASASVDGEVQDHLLDLAGVADDEGGRERGGVV